MQVPEYKFLGMLITMVVIRSLSHFGLLPIPPLTPSFCPPQMKFDPYPPKMSLKYKKIFWT